MSYTVMRQVSCCLPFKMVAEQGDVMSDDRERISEHIGERIVEGQTHSERAVNGKVCCCTGVTDDYRYAEFATGEVKSKAVEYARVLTT